MVHSLVPCATSSYQLLQGTYHGIRFGTVECCYRQSFPLCVHYNSVLDTFISTIAEDLHE